MSERVHILGICGTFMGGVALLARELGYRVSGSDTNVYPPMSSMLEDAGIEISEGYSPEHLVPAPDLVVIGNALSRGNACVEYVLNQKIPYISGPQWLGELLTDRWVMAVSGTHGKTTTSSMLTWILQCAGENPGFLVGGVPFGFEGSARLGSGPFVVEADEYDSAFFDKRSKFVHYKPKTLVINNLEFDHADIFDDLAAIQTQFHHLIRCVPSSGKIVAGAGEAIDGVLSRGVWTPVERMGSSDTNTWSVDALTKSYSQLSVQAPHGECCEFVWSLIGRHNAENALSAIAAAFDVGVPVHVSCEALSQFQGVKRRLELLGEPAGVSVYDDFAHHPTAIASTLLGVRSLVEEARVIAVVELRSNTMKDGTHRSALIPATDSANTVFWFQPEGAQWSLRDNTQDDPRHHVFNTVGALHDALIAELQAGDHVVIMSNGSFSGLHQQLLQSLTDSASNTEY